MAFGKTQEAVIQQRERFNLDIPYDLAKVKSFEKELESYKGRSKEIFGKVLTGFDLYLHENGLFRYTTKYPTGAVVYDNLEKYRLAVMKRKALDELNDRRKWAAEHENERMQYIPAEATA